MVKKILKGAAIKGRECFRGVVIKPLKLSDTVYDYGANETADHCRIFCWEQQMQEEGGSEFLPSSNVWH